MGEPAKRDPVEVQLREQEAQVQAREALAQLKQLAGTSARLREATLDVFASLAFPTARDLHFDVNDAAGHMGGTVMPPPYYHLNRGYGEYIPVYAYEMQVRNIRDRMRILGTSNEFVLCAVENRINYILGDGFKYTATPKDITRSAHRHSAARVQAVIDDWSELNDMPALEAEALKRWDVEGEFFVRGFRDRKGYLHHRFIEPEYVTNEAAGPNDPQNTFGVVTASGDLEDVQGFHVVEDPTNNFIDTKYVSADRILHAKQNVPRTAKRGLSTFYPVERNLRRCEELLGSMSAMAKARAKIALIRKITGLTSATAETLLQKLTAIQVTDPQTAETLNIERLRDGTVLTASGGTEYEFPSGQVGASDYVEVLQAELRAIASRLQMPEWMFTALPDAKYSNAFVVEAPTLRRFKRDQRVLRTSFGLNRGIVGYECRRSLLWRQLYVAVDAGILSEDDLNNVEIGCEGPSLEVRDRAAEVTRHKELMEMQLESKETAQRQLELDPDTENPKIERDKVGKARPVQDLNAVTALQAQYTSGQLSRAAAGAALQIVLGFAKEQAEALLPIDPAVNRTSAPAQPDGGSGPGGDGSHPGGDGDATPTPGADPDSQAADKLLASALGGAASSGGDDQASGGAPAGPPETGLSEQAGAKGKGKGELVLREKFTGVITASNGVEYHYVDGVRVSGPQHDAHVAKFGKASPIVNNPDPQHFANLVHLIGEHYTKGEADWKVAGKAIDKLLKKYGGGVDKWKELGKQFGLDTAKKSSSEMLEAIKTHLDTHGTDAGRIAAAKGEPAEGATPQEKVDAKKDAETKAQDAAKDHVLNMQKIAEVNDIGEATEKLSAYWEKHFTGKPAEWEAVKQAAGIKDMQNFHHLAAHLGAKPAAAPAPAAEEKPAPKPKGAAKNVGMGYGGGVTNVELDDAKQKLIQDVEVNKFDKAKLAILLGPDAANTFWKLKAGGAYTPNAVIKAMGWDTEKPAAAPAPAAETPSDPFGGTATPDAPEGEGHNAPADFAQEISHYMNAEKSGDMSPAEAYGESVKALDTAKAAGHDPKKIVAEILDLHPAEVDAGFDPNKALALHFGVEDDKTTPAQGDATPELPPGHDPFDGPPTPQPSSEGGAVKPAVPAIPDIPAGVTTHAKANPFQSKSGKQYGIDFAHKDKLKHTHGMKYDGNTQTWSKPGDHLDALGDETKTKHLSGPQIDAAANIFGKHAGTIDPSDTDALVALHNAIAEKYPGGPKELQKHWKHIAAKAGLKAQTPLEALKKPGGISFDAMPLKNKLEDSAKLIAAGKLTPEQAAAKYADEFHKHTVGLGDPALALKQLGLHGLSTGGVGMTSAEELAAHLKKQALMLKGVNALDVSKASTPEAIDALYQKHVANADAAQPAAPSATDTPALTDSQAAAIAAAAKDSPNFEMYMQGFLGDPALYPEAHAKAKAHFGIDPGADFKTMVKEIKAKVLAGESPGATGIDYHINELKKLVSAATSDDAAHDAIGEYLHANMTGDEMIALGNKIGAKHGTNAEILAAIQNGGADAQPAAAKTIPAGSIQAKLLNAAADHIAPLQNGTITPEDAAHAFGATVAKLITEGEDAHTALKTLGIIDPSNGKTFIENAEQYFQTIAAQKTAAPADIAYKPVDPQKKFGGAPATPAVDPMATHKHLANELAKIMGASKAKMTMHQKQEAMQKLMAMHSAPAVKAAWNAAMQAAGASHIKFPFHSHKAWGAGKYTAKSKDAAAALSAFVKGQKLDPQTMPSAAFTTPKPKGVFTYADPNDVMPPGDAGAPNVAKLPTKSEPAKAPAVSLGSDSGHKPKVADPTAKPGNPKLSSAKTAAAVHPEWAAMDGIPAEKQKYGTLITRTDPATGKLQVLLVEPTNHYDGYVWTFPKGEHDQATPGLTAVKEAAEEAGHNVELTDALPQVFGSAGVSKYAYFIGKSAGESGTLKDGETQATKWADLDSAHELINQTTKETGKARDLAILNALKKHLGTTAVDADPKVQGLASELKQALSEFATQQPPSEQITKTLATKLSGYHPSAIDAAAAQAGLGDSKTLLQNVLNHVHGHSEHAGFPLSVGAMLKSAKPVGEGSTGAKVATTPAGKFVIKDGGSAPHGQEQVENEVASDKIYRLLGASVPASKLYTEGGKKYKVAKWVEGESLQSFLTKHPVQTSAIKKKIQQHFVATALLGNWDAIGLNHDNIKIVDGEPHFIDNGSGFDISATATKKGAAQGKPYNSTVDELTHLLDSSKAPQSAGIFKGISKADVKAQIANVVKQADKIVAATPAAHKTTMQQRIEHLKKWAATDGKPNAKGLKNGTHGTVWVSPHPDISLASSSQAIGAPPELVHYLNHITPEEASAIGHFTGSYSSTVNKPLYNKTSHSAQGKKLDENLQGAFAKAVPPNEPMQLKRRIDIPYTESGEKFIKILQRAAKSGMPVKWRNYQSSTIGGHYGSGMNALFEIHNVTEGVLDAKPLSGHDSEEEILLNRGTFYRIKSYNKVGGKHHIVMEQVPAAEASKGKYLEAAALAPVGENIDMPEDTPPQVPGRLTPEQRAAKQQQAAQEFIEQMNANLRDHFGEDAPADALADPPDASTSK